MHLTNEFERHLAVLKTKFEQFPWQDRTAYAMWLAQTYYFVQHSCRLLALTATKYGPAQHESYLHAVQHLREESGHDVLAIKDLKALGFDLSAFPELPQTSAFYQSQYYWIDYHTPTALQGYALMLEGLAAREAGKAATLIDKHHGKGKSTFLKVHAADDVDHFADGLAGLATVSEATAAVVQRNLEQSAWLYAAMMDDVVKWAKAQVGTQRAA